MVREGKPQQRQLVTRQVNDASLARQTAVRGREDAHLPIVTSGPAGAEGGCVCVFGLKQLRASKQAVSVWERGTRMTSAMREFGGHTGVR